MPKDSRGNRYGPVGAARPPCYRRRGTLAPVMVTNRATSTQRIPVTPRCFMSLRYTAGYTAALCLIVIGPLTGQTPAAAQTPATPLDPARKTELGSPIVDVPLIKNGEFYFVDVLVNDKPFRFTIETGASFFAVGERVVRALGLPI